jgi:hypothetical protein
VVVETLLAIGDVPLAERLARIAEERAAGRLRVLYAALALGDAALRRGPSQWAEAERSLARALALADAIGMRSVRALILIARGRLAMARGDAEAARADWCAAREICAALGLRRYERIALALMAEGTGDSVGFPAPGASAAVPAVVSD